MNGQIITFYSYKGGTGRSMALANVAWILASGGKRVLTVDWDLEAPGLHRYFYPFLLDKDLTATDGVIDFVSQFAIEAMTPSKSAEPLPRDWYTRHANLNRYATNLDYQFPRNGRLDFISAGRQGPAYSSKVNSFDWQTFYSRLGGGVVLEAAKEKMREEYDYVLIDSRTGVSDTSGISTVQMPDVLVVCFTLNNQSIEGSSAVANSIAAQRKLAARNGAGLQVFPVAMRVDPFEKKKLDLRKAYAQLKFEDFPDHLSPEERERFRGEVQFPYVPYYAYEEILASFGDKPGESNTLLQAAERLTAYLTGPTGQTISRLEPPDEEVRRQVLQAYEGRPAQPEQYDVFLLYAAEDESWAAQLAGQLSRETWKRGKLILFFAARDVRPGEAIEAKVQSALANSRNILVVLSPAALRSEWFNKMLSQCQSAGSQSRLIPLRLDDSAVPNSLVRFAHIDFPRQLLFRRAVQSSDVADKLDEAGDHLADDAKGPFQRLLAVIKDEPLPVAAPVIAPPAPAPAATPKTQFKPVAPVEEAEAILQGGTATPKEMLNLARRLKAAKKLWLTRKILKKALADPALATEAALKLKLQQELVLCTYKDPDLTTDWRLDEALQLLGKTAEPLATTQNQETLGLAGAIHKRKWEFDGQIQHLERSLNYYSRGYQAGPDKDFGYTGINAAFVLDVLASLESAGAGSSGAVPPTARARRAEAARIRETLVSTLPPLAQKLENQWLNDEWWFQVTVAEAYFGLRNYQAAQGWLQRAAALPKVPSWEYESTARQLAAIARLQEDPQAEDKDAAGSPAWQVLAQFLGKNLHGTRVALLGKMGLALSGGGFRASLFHIGVLARLAELDVLRHVEVLSCVSGGSIIGAHYYLEVRKLLQEKADSEITREDYVQLVERLARDFLAGVQKNLRTRVAASFVSNLKMMFLPNYSRTERLGELLEEEIFSCVKDGEGGARWLTKLFIKPKGEAPDFAPKHENWQRQAKVPILVLNATALNTGHNWQFTASWMGEPPAAIGSEVDGNERLRRLYYEDAPPPHNQVRLGKAVAASACVPGLFDPINLSGLYPERLVRLVDGGVHDNQGTVSLLEQDCTLLLVSDASGQMDTENYPGNNPLKVPLRSNSILMGRVREAEYLELKARRRSSLLRGLVFLHLKKDLSSDPVDWLGCPPYNRSDVASQPETSYGIDKDVQRAVAGLRTDLDSFSDAEAFALMTSGYRMAEREFSAGLPGFPTISVEPHRWKFLELEPAMGLSPHPQTSTQRLLRMLKVGKERAFKVWRLSSALKIMVGAIGLAGVLAWVALKKWPGLGLVEKPDWTYVNRFFETAAPVFLQFVAVLLGLGCVMVVFAKLRAPSERLIDLFGKMLAGFGLSTLGTPLAWLHLAFFDKAFLRSSTCQKVLGTEHTPAAVSPVARSKVFLSSTVRDLKEFRLRVQRVLSREGYAVLGGEDFLEADAAFKGVAACDVFLAIIAWRYGWVPEADNPEKKSLVELEYQRAREQGKECFIFLLDEDIPWPPSMIEKGPGEQQLARFRSELRLAHTVQHFSGIDDLERKVVEALVRHTQPPENRTRPD